MRYAKRLSKDTNLNSVNKQWLSRKIKVSRKIQHRIAYGVIGFALLMIIANLFVFWGYRNKTYPKTSLNNLNIGSVKFADLNQKTKAIIKIPPSVTLKLKDKSMQVNAEQLGVSVNYNQIIKEIRQNRSLIPIMNFLILNNVNTSYNLDSTISAILLESIKPELEVSPYAPYIKLQETEFIMVPAQPSVTIDQNQANQAIISQLKNGQSEIELPFNEIPAPESSINIENEAKKLNDSINTKITINFNLQSKTLNKSEIASLFVPKDNSYTISSVAVSTLLDSTSKQFGIVLGNRPQASLAITSALTHNKKTEINLTSAPKKQLTYSYCVSAKGVDESYLSALRSKLQVVYGDMRGWSVNGQIKFVPTDSGCSFTVWLTKADLVPSFSSTICDNIWSCRVGNNVILNFDRWTNASPAWNSAGGSLEDYRTMVINHETGHWLDFRHRYCGGAGQLAPVMQQQSISLQGCGFNSWPTASEIDSLKTSKNL